MLLNSKVLSVVNADRPVLIKDLVSLLAAGTAGKPINILKGGFPWDPSMGKQIVWGGSYNTSIIRKVIQPLSFASLITHPLGYNDSYSSLMNGDVDYRLKNLASKCMSMMSQLKVADPKGMAAAMFIILAGETKGQLRLWNGCSDFGFSIPDSVPLAKKNISTAFGLGQWLDSNNILYYNFGIKYLEKKLGDIDKVLSLPFAALEDERIMWAFNTFRLFGEGLCTKWFNDFKNKKSVNVNLCAHSFMQNVQYVFPDSDSYAVDSKISQFKSKFYQLIK